MPKVNRPIQLPCPLLSRQIGNVISEIEQTTSPAARRQLELQLASLEQLFEKQCEPKLGGTQQAEPKGLSGTVRFIDGSLFLSVTNERANVVTVLFGGNDGVLITIDGHGHIHVLPPEGPGDPEVRQAVTAALQTMNLLGAAAATNLASASA
jgi:hypothetical protein